jgi:phosphate transport system permease protein
MKAGLMDARTGMRSTRYRKRSEFIAKGFIWLAAAVTIGVLILIIGFILVRGFYSSQVREYEVTPFKAETLDGMIVIVHEDLRLDDITVYDLKKAFESGFLNWAKLTAQDFDMVCFAFPASSGQGRVFAESLNLRGGDFGPLAEFVGSEEEMLRMVRETHGAIGFVPASFADKLRGVRVIPVRTLSVAVHPSALELKDNIKLQVLSEEVLHRIFQGKIGNFADIGGVSLPVRPVFPPAGSEIDETLASQGIRPYAGSRQAATMEEYLAYLKTEPGAIGFLPFVQAEREAIPVVRSERIEKGANLTLSFILEPPKLSGKVGGVSTIILNTVYMILLTLLFSTPIGVAAAIYLVEYARQGRLVRILRLGTETLAGSPSIIFGLFGMIFFVNILKWGIGLLSGTLTLTLMILPTIIRTSEEALKTVPKSFREGSLALGATKLQTIMKVVIPAATPGILTGIILAIGRSVGETAALIFTMGSNYDLAHGLFASTRVLAVHLYLIIAEGISFDRAFATATILIFIVLIVNVTTTRLIGRINRMAGK